MKWKLIPEWRSGLKMWSIRFGALGSIIVTALVSVPDWALMIWAQLPEEFKAAVPPKYMPLIGVAFFVMGMLSRFIQQEKLRRAAIDAQRKLAEKEFAKSIEVV